jgi:GTP-binding protein YchF
MELIFSDMEMVERRIERTKKAMKGDKTLAGELALFERIYAVLEEGKCARTMTLTEDEQACLFDTPLLTMKPVIYVANVSEDDAGGDPSDNAMYEALKVHAASEGAEVIAICAGIEAEIAELSGEEKQMFLDDLGIPESGLDRLIKKSYALLGLISYLTAGPEEVRAWTIVKGTKAPQAAGKIHSDFERGFIRAEVVAFEDLERLGSMNAVREAGLYRSEGKDYVMKDGDIVLYRFNV